MDINYGESINVEGNIADFTRYGNEIGGSYTLAIGYQYSEHMCFEKRYSHKENESEGTKSCIFPVRQKKSST